LCIVCKNLYNDKLQFLKHLNEDLHKKAVEEIKNRARQKHEQKEEEEINVKRKAEITVEEVIEQDNLQDEDLK
jgi:hypothetical protein